MKKKLLVLTEPRGDGQPLSGYQSSMFNTMLDYAESITGRWGEVELVSADDPMQAVRKHGGDCVLLMGERHAELIGKISPMEISKLHGPQLYGMLTEHKGKRYIATPYLYDYGLGDLATPRRASLLGHLYRHLEQLAIGDIGWENPGAPSKYRLVRNMEDWHELRALLETAKIVAIDTETRNLQRIANTILTLQFGVDGHTGWVVPIAHPETPLSGKEIRIIIKWLKNYFERGKRSIHVYANAVFDLHQIIDLCKIDWYNHKVYDVQAGQFNLDENYSSRASIGFGKGEMWSLERLCLEANMDHYNRTRLGKSDRSRLETKPLEDVAEYGGVDVVLPIRLMRMQLALAKWRTEHMIGHPYRRFFKAVTEVEGNKIQQFCFHPDTIVDTERGPVSISQLVSDADRPRVWSFNHATCEKSLQKIDAVSVHLPNEPMVEIEHEYGKLIVTESHEVWCVNRGCYVCAKDLNSDDELLCVMRKSKVVSVKSIPRTDLVCDITVANNHNLFASGGGDFILAHNCFMERHGLKVDIDYVISLRGTSSVFLEVIRKAEEKWKKLPAVVKANEMMLKKRNVRGGQLFGGSKDNAFIFDSRKKEHLVTLFFDLLKLKPLKTGKDGSGSLDKVFKEKYKDNPTVAAYQDYEEAKTLYGNFVKSFYDLLRGMADNRDGRLRTIFKFLNVITGRSSSTVPNLQNIPQRKKERAKIINRQFVCERGKLYIKRDYSAHEVRVWGISSRDPAIAQTFWTGMRTRLEYLALPKIPLEDKVKWENALKGADVHHQNYGLLYGVDPVKVSKTQRDGVKTTIFGSLYGYGMATLARVITAFIPKRIKDIDVRLDVIDDLIDKMQKRNGI